MDKQEQLQKEVEFGAQQDVTEAISNVLFQLQCAIKAESIDESGEQIDQIKRLFFGKLKATTTDKDGKARTKEEFFPTLKSKSLVLETFMMLLMRPLTRKKSKLVLHESHSLLRFPSSHQSSKFTCPVLNSIKKRARRSSPIIIWH